MSEVLRLTERVAAALATRILSGTWPENHKFPADADLCAEFAVSRTVIREALRLLGAKGLIMAVPRRGTHVALREKWALWDKDVLQWLTSSADGINKYDLSGDALDMRLALEPTLAALAAARADDSANTALQESLRALQQTNGHEAEMVYLKAFYSAAGNDFAIAALPLAQFALKHRAAAPPLEAYQRLTAAIAQKDGVAARQAAVQALLTA
ncbi:MAG: putative HTH-type transcriptional regulator [Alphaproteobacteria bacterium]|nr:MAG: putative HTH-type transcriptional regulator [Alphaproteobacteria bacterium]